MEENWKLDVKDISYQDEVIYSRKFYTDPEAVKVWIEHSIDNKPSEQLCHHKIPYPDITEETAIETATRKRRVWALPMLRILPQYWSIRGGQLIERR